MYIKQQALLTIHTIAFRQKFVINYNAQILDFIYFIIAWSLITLKRQIRNLLNVIATDLKLYIAIKFLTHNSKRDQMFLTHFDL